VNHLEQLTDPLLFSAPALFGWEGKDAGGRVDRPVWMGPV
jgi:hypothetical protein